MSSDIQRKRLAAVCEGQKARLAQPGACLARARSGCAALLQLRTETRTLAAAYRVLAAHRRQPVSRAATTAGRREAKAAALAAANAARLLGARYLRLRLLQQHRRLWRVVGTVSSLLGSVVAEGSVADMCAAAVLEVEAGREARVVCEGLKGELASSALLRRQAQADFDEHNSRMQAALQNVSSEVLASTAARKEMVRAFANVHVIVQATHVELSASSAISRDAVLRVSSNIGNAAEGCAWMAANLLSAAERVTFDTLLPMSPRVLSPTRSPPSRAYTPL